MICVIANDAKITTGKIQDNACDQPNRTSCCMEKKHEWIPPNFINVTLTGYLLFFNKKIMK
ncbi:hypothetical protein [Cytobacillus kochii]|uniref:hypothetical protein n=1 Tax=Cytobacillus kochii TaxID=859143 RepID=UPI001F33C7D9|nr:hypothetical protein [Cytobacillus kochii]